MFHQSGLVVRKSLRLRLVYLLKFLFCDFCSNFIIHLNLPINILVLRADLWLWKLKLCTISLNLSSYNVSYILTSNEWIYIQTSNRYFNSELCKPASYFWMTTTNLQRIDLWSNSPVSPEIICHLKLLYLWQVYTLSRHVKTCHSISS